MGVEHYLVCGQCKEYIDLHKAYAFSANVTNERPPAGAKIYSHNVQHDYYLNGGYWESRGLWFLWHHKGHQGIELMYDSNDDWYEKEPYLKEVFKHEDDCKLRE